MSKERSPPPPSGKQQELLDRADALEILDIIDRSKSTSHDLRSKDVIVFLSGSRVGKSTTIDALLGAKLVYHKATNSIQLAPGAEKDLRIAEIGDIPGVSTTTVPALYDSPKCPYTFLDTRGYFDVRMDPNEDVAAAIITELILQTARSVRIVYLCDCHTFSEGLTSFARFGETLKSIVFSTAIPVYFLFNKYTPTVEQDKQGFYGKPYSEKLPIIMESLRKSQQNIDSGVQHIMSGIMERCKKRLERAGLLRSDIQDVDASVIDSVFNNPEYDEAAEKFSYSDMLRQSFQNGWYGYIDPLDPDSLASFLQQIAKFPGIKAGDPIFSHKGEDRVRFNSKFEGQVLRLNGLLRQKAFALQFRGWIEPWEKKLQKMTEQCENDYSEMSKPERDPAAEKRLTEFYTKEIAKTKVDNEAVIATFRTLLEKINLKLAGLKGEAPAKIHTWKEEAKAYWWRDHPVRYNALEDPKHPIPYTRYEEKLAEDTLRTSVITDDHIQFHAIYSSASNKGKTLRKLTAFLGLVWSAVSSPSAGTVTFYANREDIEWKTVQALKSEKTIVEQKIADFETREAEARAKPVLSLPDKIRIVQQYTESTIKTLHEIDAFVKEIVALWTAEGERNPTSEVNRFYEYAQKLFRRNELESVETFCEQVRACNKLGEFSDAAKQPTLAEIELSLLRSQFSVVKV